MHGHGIELVSGEDALSQLREHTGLHERVPVIFESHLAYLAVGNEQGDDPIVTMCCHDRANERAHQLSAPYTALPPTEQQFLAQANLILAAAWN
jgi:hypothetical protein